MLTGVDQSTLSRLETTLMHGSPSEILKSFQGKPLTLMIEDPKVDFPTCRGKGFWNWLGESILRRLSWFRVERRIIQWAIVALQPSCFTVRVEFLGFETIQNVAKLRLSEATLMFTKKALS